MLFVVTVVVVMTKRYYKTGELVNANGATLVDVDVVVYIVCM